MSISSINPIGGAGRTSLPNTTGIISPNWNMIPSANMSTLSKGEIITQVKELAGQAAKATDKEKDAIQDKVQELYTQYVSFSSPDRKSLYEQALKTIAKEAGCEKKGSDGANPQKTLFDFLNERDRNGLKLDKAYQMEGGGTVTASAVTGGGYIFDIGYGGNTVMSINVGRIYGNGVYYTPTPAEQALQKEISDIYHKTVEYAKSCPSSNSTVGKPTDNTIDIKV